MNISKINPIMINKTQYSKEIVAKGQEIKTSNTNVTALPNHIDAKCLVNVSFKGLDFSPLGEAIFHMDKKKFDKLIYDSNTNVNEIGCGYHGEYPIELACDNLGQNEPYYLEMLLQRPDLDLYPKVWDPLVTLLHLSHRKNFKRYFEVILKHPHVKTEGFLEYAKKYDSWPGDKDYIPYFSTIKTMVKEYEYGVDRREHLIIFNPVIDAHRVLSLDEVWTPEEKTEIRKLIDEKDYDKLALIYTEKGFSLAEEAKNIPELKAATEKAVREETTALIHNEEKTALETALSKREQEVTKAEADLKTKKEQLDMTIKDKTDAAFKKERADLERRENALNKREKKLDKDEAALKAKEQAVAKQKAGLDQLALDYEKMLTDDINAEMENRAAALMMLYGVTPPEKLPEDMNYDEQVVYVRLSLIPRQEKITDIDDDAPDKITEALRDASKKISSEGLRFVEDIIDLSKEQCEVEDILAAINTVKGNHGLLDMKKVRDFLSIQALGKKTIKNTLERISLKTVK